MTRTPSNSDGPVIWGSSLIFSLGLHAGIVAVLMGMEIAAPDGADQEQVARIEIMVIEQLAAADPLPTGVDEELEPSPEPLEAIEAESVPELEAEAGEDPPPEEETAAEALEETELTEADPVELEAEVAEADAPEATEDLLSEEEPPVAEEAAEALPEETALEAVEEVVEAEEVVAAEEVAAQPVEAQPEEEPVETATVEDAEPEAAPDVVTEAPPVPETGDFQQADLVEQETEEADFLASEEAAGIGDGPAALPDLVESTTVPPAPALPEGDVIAAEAVEADAVPAEEVAIAEAVEDFATEDAAPAEPEPVAGGEVVVIEADPIPEDSPAEEDIEVAALALPETTPTEAEPSEAAPAEGTEIEGRQAEGLEDGAPDARRADPEEMRQLRLLVERIRLLSDRPCLVAMPRRHQGGAISVEIVGAEDAAMAGLETDIFTDLAVEPSGTRRLVSPEQCAALEFVRDARDYPIMRLGIGLATDPILRDATRSELEGIGRLQAAIIARPGWNVTLLLIDDTGVVQDLTEYLFEADGTQQIDVPVRRSAAAGPTRQILLALASAGPLEALRAADGQLASEVFAANATALADVPMALMTVDIR